MTRPWTVQPPRPKVSVCFITYNQERYVAKAIESVLAQRTDFAIELVIGEDCSSDRTGEICRQYRNRHPDIIRLVQRPLNVGAVGNYLRTYAMCRGTYVAFLEGDDYWVDPNKLQTQVDFLDAHPQFAICCHDVLVVDENGQGEDTLLAGTAEDTTVEELCRGDYIATASCVVRNRLLERFPDWLYGLQGCDWALDILHAEHGRIRFLPQAMAVYRVHGASVWSSKPAEDKYAATLDTIGLINRETDYRYALSFQVFEQRIRYLLKGLAAERAPAATVAMLPVDPATVEAPWAAPVDLVILDDVFPHPLSAFRFQEFHAYLEAIPSTMVYSTGASLAWLDPTRTIDEVIDDGCREHPMLRGRVHRFRPEVRLDATLAYMVFMGNAISFLQTVERDGIPFVFTLYPGGYFAINLPERDEQMRRVFDSPCFRKVIVTQRITQDYLLEKGFCRPEQIALIYGVVTPLANIGRDIAGKRHYGIDKAQLDICFVAHKYSADGADKGLDVFMAVAKALARRHDNIVFHIVGGFGVDDVDVGDLEGRVHFYGLRNPEWFATFYLDKDIILSPNLPFKLGEGYFDGFPTGCCTDAALHGVAMFCTDILKLNTVFEPDRDIVILPYNVQRIVETIGRYIDHPVELKAIAQRGRQRCVEVYGYDSQIAPRIDLLRAAIGQELAAAAPRKAVG